MMVRMLHACMGAALGMALGLELLISVVGCPKLCG